jgi:peptidyl-prolyl cis-trans isomerase SurA
MIASQINKIIVSLIVLLSFQTIWSQNQKTDTIKPKKEINKKRIKVDGIVATVGDYTILDSDIDKSLLELSSQDISIKDITRCQMLGKLMEERLYAHHAIQDSLKITDAEVKSNMEEKIGTMVEQIGSMDKLVAFYKQKNEEEFRSFFFDILKLNRLTSDMQKKIVDAVEITPEETKTFFNKIPKNELPIFGDEVELSQIVIKPKVSAEEKQNVIDKLKEFKKEIQSEGASFATKAVLYSQDPGSKAEGGLMKINRKTPLVKEFKEVAFSLNEGEISEPFETMYGYHIIYIEKIRGQELDLRHILLYPKITEESMKEARKELESIKQKINDKKVTFAEAARNSSEEKETKANGGIIVNPRTMDTRFELTKMDPSLYGQVSDLKEGEISNVISDDDQTGKRIFKLLTVTKRYAAHTADYANDYLKIKELALKEKQIKTIGKWSTEKIRDTYVKVNGEYKDCPFSYNWLKK